MMTVGFQQTTEGKIVVGLGVSAGVKVLLWCLFSWWFLIDVGSK